MRGVGLTYKGQPVKTAPDFAVDWEWTDDPFDIFSIAEGSSYPISLPMAGNEHIFFDAGDPDSTHDMDDIDDFAITQDGNILWQCVFQIDSISDDRKYYKGTLSTIDTKLYENKDKSIRELLAERTWSYPAGSLTTIYSYFNGSTNRGIRFPWMHYYNETNFVYPTASIVHIINSDAFAVPCFHMEHILRVLMEELGYEVNINLTKPHLENLLMYTNNMIKLDGAGGELTYGEYLPDMSLTDFIREVEFYTGGSVYKHPDEKIIRVESPQYTQKEPPVDISGKTGEAIPGKFIYKNVSARMNFDADFLLSENPPELTGNYLGEFVDAQDIEISSGGAEGDYAFARAESAYYKFITVNNNLELEYYSHPFLERKTGNEDSYEFESELSPCIKDKYYFGEFEVDADLVEGPASPVAGKCLIQGFEDQSIVTEYDRIGISEFKTRETQATRSYVRMNQHNVSRKNKFESSKNLGNEFYKDKYFKKVRKVTAPVANTGKKITGEYYIGFRKPKLYPTYSTSTGVNPDDNKIHFTMEYIEDAEVSKIVMAKQLDYYIPIIGKKLSRGDDVYLIQESNDRDLSGGVLIWHGMQYNFGKTSTYPYASCDNFYFNSIDFESELDTQNLNFHTGTNNMWTNIFNPLYTLYRNLKLITFSASLSAATMTKLITRRIGNAYKRKFLIKSVRVSYDKDGISEQQIEGYRL